MVAMLTLAACTGNDPEAAPEPESSVNQPSPRTSPEPSPSASPSASAEPPHPVSLPALAAKEYDGRGLRRVEEVASTAAYTQHRVIYRSGRLRISGLMNVPRGRGPFPALVLAHGYIDPEIYVNGQGLRREQDYLASAGYVTLHVDYRNHAQSDRSPRAERDLRLGYTEDVINAVLALREWRGPVDDERIGLLGRSMGGGVVYNVLTVAPGLVDAAVVFAPVSSKTAENFNRWIRDDPGRDGVARQIIDAYGDPNASGEFWRNVSPRTFFDQVTEPVLLHHGTSDDSCPIRWSRQTVAAMRKAGVDVDYRVYDGEEHAFGPQWPLSMQRTVVFLKRRLTR